MPTKHVPFRWLVAVVILLGPISFVRADSTIVNLRIPMIPTLSFPHGIPYRLALGFLQATSSKQLAWDLCCSDQEMTEKEKSLRYVREVLYGAARNEIPFHFGVRWRTHWTDSIETSDRPQAALGRVVCAGCCGQLNVWSLTPNVPGELVLEERFFAETDHGKDIIVFYQPLSAEQENRTNTEDLAKIAKFLGWITNDHPTLKTEFQREAREVWDKLTPAEKQEVESFMEGKSPEEVSGLMGRLANKNYAYNSNIGTFTEITPSPVCRDTSHSAQSALSNVMRENIQAVILNPISHFPGFYLNVWSSDPNERMEQMLFQSENYRKLREEYRRGLSSGTRYYLTPDRIHSDITP
ncbi:MAG: hypothetical protein ACFCD0_18625 [Gemmataceae bacterium]